MHSDFSDPNKSCLLLCILNDIYKVKWFRLTSVMVYLIFADMVYLLFRYIYDLIILTIDINSMNSWCLKLNIDRVRLKIYGNLNCIYKVGRFLLLFFSCPWMKGELNENFMPGSRR